MENLIEYEHRPVNFDALSEFKPTKEFIRTKIKELNQQCYDIKKKKNNPEYEIVWTILDEQHQKLLRLIRRYQYYLKPGEDGQQSGQSVSDLDIARAREYPISELYPGKLRKSGNRFLGTCPFHSEKSPSFVVYPGGKGWYCFGCGTGGNAVDFLIKLQNIKFIDAVKILCKK